MSGDVGLVQRQVHHALHPHEGAHLLSRDHLRSVSSGDIWGHLCSASGDILHKWCFRGQDCTVQVLGLPCLSRDALLLEELGEDQHAGGHLQGKSQIISKVLDDLGLV